MLTGTFSVMNPHTQKIKQLKRAQFYVLKRLHFEDTEGYVADDIRPKSQNVSSTASEKCMLLVPSNIATFIRSQDFTGDIIMLRQF